MAALRPACRRLGGLGLILAEARAPPRAWRHAPFAAAAAPSRHFAAAAGSVPAALVKQLRDRTGASMGKCREALNEEAGDVEKAVEWLRRRGVRSMEKRTAEAVEALLAINVAGDSSAGAIVELRCETDFVTRSEPFQQLCTCLAAAAAGSPAAAAGAPALSAEATLGDVVGRPKQLKPETAVGAALLELGSVLGERLVLGESSQLAAPSGGVVAGYVHPKFSDGQPNTGRMAALVALGPLPSDASPSPATSERLRAVATQLARHIVAAQPRFVSVASVPSEVITKERESFRAAHLEQLGSRKAGTVDEKVMTKVLDGKMQKFYSESVLLCQELIAPSAAAAPSGGKADAKAVPVSEWLEAEAKALGLEKIAVEDFRFVSL